MDGGQLLVSSRGRDQEGFPSAETRLHHPVSEKCVFLHWEAMSAGEREHEVVTVEETHEEKANVPKGPGGGGPIYGDPMVLKGVPNKVMCS